MSKSMKATNVRNYYGSHKHDDYTGEYLHKSHLSFMLTQTGVTAMLTVLLI